MKKSNLKYRIKSDKIKPTSVEDKRKGQRELLKRKGLKSFDIDGISVMALNYKNAVRKVNNYKKNYNVTTTAIRKGF